MGQELLLFVLREPASDGLDEKRIEVRRIDPFQHHLVQVTKSVRAELGIALGVEVVIGKFPVGGQPAVVVEIWVFGHRLERGPDPGAGETGER